MSLAQEKIPLYASDAKVTIAGFDKEPPYIDHYPAKGTARNRRGILICPGGGYGFLADQHEGKDVADFFTRRGYEAFVLHYRLNNPEQQGHRYPDQYNDVTTALRLVKSRAESWGIDPERIGILGFSAGGHLASMGTTMHVAADPNGKTALDRVSSRPAFSILIYPVILLSGPYAHKGSAENLLGKNADQATAQSLSTNTRVDKQTPPVFLVYSDDDTVVPPENGIAFYQALRKAGVHASLHIYPHGGHGYGMAPDDLVLNTWPGLAADWIDEVLK